MLCNKKKTNAEREREEQSVAKPRSRNLASPRFQLVLMRGPVLLELSCRDRTLFLGKLQWRKSRARNRKEKEYRGKRQRVRVRERKREKLARERQRDCLARSCQAKRREKKGIFLGVRRRQHSQNRGTSAKLTIGHFFLKLRCYI